MKGLSEKTGSETIALMGRWLFILLCAVALGVSITQCTNDDRILANSSRATAVHSQLNAAYVGSEKCADCHAALYQSWKSTNHTKKFLSMEDENILCDSDDDGVNDFKQGIQLGSSATDAYNDSDWSAYGEIAPILGYNQTTGRYTVTMGTKVWTVESIIGGSGRWKQRYTTPVTVGNNVVNYVLPLQYNVNTNRWTTYNANRYYTAVEGGGYTTTDLPPLNKSWEAYCVGCHATGVTEAYIDEINVGSDGRKNHIVANYTEANIGCEACHGPGSKHVSLGGGRGTINNPALMAEDRGNEVCSTCHGRGEGKYPMTSADGVVNDFHAEYSRNAEGDFYKPGDVLEDYREFIPNSNTANIWQNATFSSKGHQQQWIDMDESKHVEAGLTCYSCHAPHGSTFTADIKMEPTELCLSCHEGTYNLTASDITKHTKHPIRDDTPTGCIDCHMPYMAKSAEAYDIRNHEFRIIYPTESDDSHGGVKGMPNSCQSGGCHSDDAIAELNTKLLTMWGNLSPVPAARAAAPDVLGAIQLDGSKSFDGNGYGTDGEAIDSLGYNWRIVSGPDTSASQIIGKDASKPWFFPTKAGTYVIELTVGDAGGAGVRKTTTVEVVATSAFAAPTASSLSVSAGPDLKNQGWGSQITTIVATPANVTGTASYDWSFEDRHGHIVSLTGGDTANPTFTNPFPTVTNDLASNGNEFMPDRWAPMGFTPVERKMTLDLHVTDDSTVSYTAGNDTVWYNRATDSVTSWIESYTVGTSEYSFLQSAQSCVSIGVPMYFMGALESQTGTALVAWTYSLSAQPAGSVATLSWDATGAQRWCYFTPDVPGVYTISYNGFSNVTMTTLKESGTYNLTAGTYVTVGTIGGDTPSGKSCGTSGCHDSRVADWQETGHAEHAERGINGTLSSKYSESCLKCHTVGWQADPAIDNGGWTDLKEQSGWTFTTGGSEAQWDALIDDAGPHNALSQRANIQCENCHGPGSEHTDGTGSVAQTATFNTSVSFDDDQCGVCHDEPNAHPRAFMLQQAGHKHSTAIESRGGNDGCTKCHSAQGFILINGQTEGNDDSTRIVSITDGETTNTFDTWVYLFKNSSKSAPTSVYITYTDDGAGNFQMDAYNNSQKRAYQLLATTGTIATPAVSSTLTLVTPAVETTASSTYGTSANFMTLNVAAAIPTTTGTSITVSILKQTVLLVEENDGSNQFNAWTFNGMNFTNTYLGRGRLYAKLAYNTGTGNVDVTIAKGSSFASGDVVASGSYAYTTTATSLDLTEQNSSGWTYGSVTVTYKTNDSDVTLEIMPQTSGLEIGCVTCHDPHDATNEHQIRRQEPITFATGVVSEDGGHGNLCLGCHQARGTWQTRGDATSSHWGPHYGISGDMLFGTNGYENFSHLMVNSVNTKAWEHVGAHSKVENTCITCHMAPDPSTVETGSLIMGEHTFKITTTDEDGRELSNVANACQGCHVNLETIDRPSKGDYDGDGHVEGHRDEFEGLHEVLGLALERAGYLTSSGSPVSGITINMAGDNLAGALWNWIAVEEDGSHGTHNFGYIIQLMQESYRAITGSYPPGADIR
ncbi:MAG: hypothetical protein NUW37_02410 [Planctomycetes bacterium]|nr:hypothetical protein [Planctomycetota bacterium]